MKLGRTLLHQFATVDHEQNPCTGLHRVGDDLRSDDSLTAAGRRNHQRAALAGLDLGGDPGDHFALVGPKRARDTGAIRRLVEI